MKRLALALLLVLTLQGCHSLKREDDVYKQARVIPCDRDNCGKKAF